MYIIKNGKDEKELRASAAAYRKLKMTLGCSNLKVAFFTAFQNVDLDFLINVIECFGKMEHSEAEAFVDEAFDNGNVTRMFEEVANFMNGMGFFGDLNLGKNVPAIDYFKNPFNKLDMDETVASAMKAALDESVTDIVREQVQQDQKK